ncbi:DUF2569 domain-containing protein [Paenibacillus sp. VCA1]|uniref:DUF2569 domain-containing protein n=1 Tax=Paenibacillus sp. VCA1 TaxID=3039148 RepID=UPI002871CD87|nr:DUF2569 domain-containing protein [Paenibacillus sp. VCA1]MDR9856179.1 DUF2569 domain-containing protein [Paenibacillus sp. VCA1]
MNPNDNLEREDQPVSGEIRGGPQASVRTDDLRGLGGWLVLVQINMYYSLLLLSDYFFRNLLPIYSPETWNSLTSPNGEYYNPHAKRLFMLETLSTAVLLGLLVVAFVLLYRKKAAFPWILICYFVLSVMFDLGTNMVFDRFLTYEDLSGAERDQYMQNGQIIRRFVFSVVWVAYLLRSKRVKNTFVH